MSSSHCQNDGSSPGWAGPIAVVVAAHLALIMLPVEFPTAHTEEEPPPEISMVPVPELDAAPEPEPEVVEEPQPEPEPEVVEEPQPEPEPEAVVAQEPDSANSNADVAVAEAPEEPAEEQVDEVSPQEDDQKLSEIEPFADHDFQPDIPSDWEPTPPPSPRRTNSSSEAVDWGHYGQGVMSAVQSEKNYPRMAERRGWEGEATVRIRIDRRGRLADRPEVVESSQHATLDDEVLRMVESAQPFETFPSGAQEEEQEFVIPIRFRLES